jgi:phosphate/sulfate permease
MDSYYIFVLVLLFFLAISDLIVGVSNDAVNFLNSAIGSKVTSRRNIMIVASLGILVGATFSSGMMEVARKGVFNPEYFMFSEIMIVFIAVMITDIILLDLFNTFGMPTSTTVSIVFELLGAAVAVSTIKILDSESSIQNLENYINSSGAIIIISGIFISVLIAFAIGGIVQYFSRLLFSFNIEKSGFWVLFIWSVSAMTALSYFLLLKGVSGASFISADFASSIQEQMFKTLISSFFFWGILLFVFHKIFNINILKVVVLFGTFALAMAFSGNDLVNFIGVPIAGLESYTAWKASGFTANSYAMTILLEPVRSKTYMLLGAGLIMILTLWFSKKARSVTETEVNLGRQSEGNERFKPNLLSKGIVRYSLTLNEQIINSLPKSWLKKAENQFVLNDSTTLKSSNHNKPAFDLIRASVNLTVASILIALATSFKLPLSTTYVSFMVAMGTSLADRAWGRNSAVFRIAGVLNVIGGWFVTALLAFSASAIFASLIYFFDLKAIIFLVLTAVVLITRTFILHSKKAKQKKAEEEFSKRNQTIHFAESLRETATNVSQTLEMIKNAYYNVLEGVLSDTVQPLKTAKQSIKDLYAKQEQLRQQLFILIKRLDDNATNSGKLYILAHDLEQDIVQSITLIVDTCTEYVENRLDPVNIEHQKTLKALQTDVLGFIDDLIDSITQQDISQIDEHLSEKKLLLDKIDNYLEDQIQTIKMGSNSMRESSLILTIILETKDLIAVATRFSKLYYRISSNRDSG